MNKQKLIWSVALLMIFAMAFGGLTAQASDVPNRQNASAPGTSSSPATPSTSNNVKINIQNKTIKKGATFSVKTSVAAKAAGSYVRFSSSNPSVARVTQAGKIKGMSFGDAVITASYGGQVATCSVKVTGPLTKIALNAKSASIKAGNTFDLKIAGMTPFNADANLSSASWSSNKSSVATVSGGVVRAVKAGKATITAKLKGKTAKCTITVTAASTSSSSSSSSSSPAPAPSTSGSVGNLEMRVLELVNAERGKKGLSKLSYYKPLEDPADVRAEEISKSFSHTRPNGDRCFTAIKFAMKYAGENIAMNFNTADAVMAAWMNSPTHKANILSPNFNEMALGVYQKNGVTYMAQLFCTRK